jgi:hypothetical protein
VIGDFQAQVIAPLLAHALPASAHRPGSLAGPRSLVLLKAAEAVIRALPYGRRGARDWRD